MDESQSKNVEQIERALTQLRIILMRFAFLKIIFFTPEE